MRAWEVYTDAHQYQFEPPDALILADSFQEAQALYAAHEWGRVDGKQVWKEVVFGKGVITGTTNVCDTPFVWHPFEEIETQERTG